MNYVGLFTPHHVAVLHDWLTELGELYVYINYPHRGGSGSAYFVRSLEDVRRLITQQTHAEIEIHIFHAIVFPIRGNDYPALLKRALQQIPDGQYYQIVAPDPYPQECVALADGKGHDELRRDIASLEAGRDIAIGVHPFDVPFNEFEQFYGAQVKQLYFGVRKNLNSYSEFIHNPARYENALAQWFGPGNSK